MVSFYECLEKQNGRLAPAYFSPNYKYFDHFFANGQKRDYCFEFSFQKVFKNINSITDFCTLCKRVSLFSVENFLSHSAGKFRRGALLCFTKFLVSKNVRNKKVGESRFSVEIVYSHNTETFRGGTLLCCV